MHVAALLLGAFGCARPGASRPPQDAVLDNDSDAVPTAAVVAVRTTGDAGDYTFHVSVLSDETGCDRYADWWEVVRSDGTLVYRRILEHSHPNEQPFERSGGPVAVQPADPLYVRAHLHPNGYGSEGVTGSVGGGFVPHAIDADFAADLATTPPLPTGCLF